MHSLKFQSSIVADTSPLQQSQEEALESSMQLIRVLKDIEMEMQAMHAKLNDMNEVGEQVGTQLNNSPQLSQSINSKMDILEAKWNALLEQMEYLSKVCTELQQIEIIKSKIAAAEKLKPSEVIEQTTITCAETVHEQAEANVDVIDSATTKKRRMQVTDEDRKGFETTVSQVNKALDNVKNIMSTAAADNLNKDEQLDLIRVKLHF